MCVSSFRAYSNRNVIKTLQCRGMLEDVFPRESVHSLGEPNDLTRSNEGNDCCSEGAGELEAVHRLCWV